MSDAALHSVFKKRKKTSRKHSLSSSRKSKVVPSCRHNVCDLPRKKKKKKRKKVRPAIHIQGDVHVNNTRESDISAQVLQKILDKKKRDWTRFYITEYATKFAQDCLETSRDKKWCEIDDLLVTHITDSALTDSMHQMFDVTDEDTDLTEIANVDTSSEIMKYGRYLVDESRQASHLEDHSDSSAGRSRHEYDTLHHEDRSDNAATTYDVFRDHSKLDTNFTDKSKSAGSGKTKIQENEQWTAGSHAHASHQEVDKTNITDKSKGTGSGSVKSDEDEHWTAGFHAQASQKEHDKSHFRDKSKHTGSGESKTAYDEKRTSGSTSKANNDYKLFAYTKYDSNDHGNGLFLSASKDKSSVSEHIGIADHKDVNSVSINDDFSHQAQGFAKAKTYYKHTDKLNVHVSAKDNFDYKDGASSHYKNTGNSKESYKYDHEDNVKDTHVYTNDDAFKSGGNSKYKNEGKHRESYEHNNNDDINIKQVHKNDDVLKRDSSSKYTNTDKSSAEYNYDHNNEIKNTLDSKTDISHTIIDVAHLETDKERHGVSLESDEASEASHNHVSAGDRRDHLLFVIKPECQSSDSASAKEDFASRLQHTTQSSETDAESAASVTDVLDNMFVVRGNRVLNYTQIAQAYAQKSSQKDRNNIVKKYLHDVKSQATKKITTEQDTKFEVRFHYDATFCDLKQYQDFLGIMNSGHINYRRKDGDTSLLALDKDTIDEEIWAFQDLLHGLLDTEVARACKR